jgi:hypothetical protein
MRHGAKSIEEAWVCTVETKGFILFEGISEAALSYIVFYPDHDVTAAKAMLKK